MEKITPERIVHIGQALFGTSWQTPMAKKYGCTARYVRYWCEGKKIPPWLTPALEDAYTRHLLAEAMMNSPRQAAE